ncbi:single-strand DNA-binding protein [Cryobacterium sp. MP_M5]|uniref:single-stranded DNA-binding protein n=1 Tax=unclassified Cryobacterium TaxID=2649013 RepID=UPI0018C8E7FF|nr:MULTISPECIES: single-stranded DNA-binding protein [unclassified Cryobacterium]MBG6057627.1 single-strand DNA-binding protein [Cryobacterium sp. MP_M3]MEC5175858.1 single-strand DNA-binding protein [Cryobacterium sp. MP_M5]
MSDIITVTGIVATTPRHLVTSTGLAITSFRLASGQRRFDRAKQSWVDAETNWYTVSTFRQLAHNVVGSVRRGEHVVVAGRLRIRDWHNADKNGTAVEIEADSVGHDLTWCTTISQRAAPAPGRLPGEPVEQAEAAEHSEPPSAQEQAAQDQAAQEQAAQDQAAQEQAESGGFLPREDAGLVTLDS